MTRGAKISKHGTLHEDDMTGAVAISIDQVLKNCQNSNVKDYFGLAGELPPSKVHVKEAEFESIYELRDSITGENFLGLNRKTSGTKGNVDIPLVPGEYRIELSLPKSLNSNFIYNISGAVVGGIASLARQASDGKEQSFRRGLPSDYLDVRIRVAGKSYGIMDVSFQMDIGIQPKIIRCFTVKESEAPATLELRMFSHSFVKRLRIVGRLLRRDIITSEDSVSSIRSLSEEGRNIIHEALNNDIEKVLPTSTRLDKDVDAVRMLVDFYNAYSPEKVKNAQVISSHFEGRIDDMIRSLEIKYNVIFDRRGRALPVGDPIKTHKYVPFIAKSDIPPTTGLYT